jgi:hypothetical protein
MKVTFVTAATIVLVAITPARADLLFNHIYNSSASVTGCGGLVGTPCVEIDVDIDNGGPLYTWTYTVKNLNFTPPNGLGGFELDLPLFPPDLGGVVTPAGWVSNCCSGAPEEWDRPDVIPNAAGVTNPANVGTALLIGQSAVFSFTSLPRTITNSTGWIHTWTQGTQTDINMYTSFAGGPLGPEVPNVLLPPVPEPESFILILGGLAALAPLTRLRKLTV